MQSTNPSVWAVRCPTLVKVNQQCSPGRLVIEMVVKLCANLSPKFSISFGRSHKTFFFSAWVRPASRLQFVPRKCQSKMVYIQQHVIRHLIEFPGALTENLEHRLRMPACSNFISTFYWIRSTTDKASRATLQQWCSGIVLFFSATVALSKNKG